MHRLCSNKSIQPQRLKQMRSDSAFDTTSSQELGKARKVCSASYLFVRNRLQFTRHTSYPRPPPPCVFLCYLVD